MPTQKPEVGDLLISRNPTDKSLTVIYVLKITEDNFILFSPKASKIFPSERKFLENYLQQYHKENIIIKHSKSE